MPGVNGPAETVHDGVNSRDAPAGPVGSLHACAPVARHHAVDSGPMPPRMPKVFCKWLTGLLTYECRVAAKPLRRASEHGGNANT